ncbi:MAG: PilZ domain-containing protein [Acidobacteria bacterium]|nr:PilZ domain-containing protein [Acidobacteriota bacterium]
MSDQPSKQSPGGVTPEPTVSTEVAERRAVDRYPFTAAVEVIDCRTGSQISARTADIGLAGCYLDMINPFPEGTLVQLQIHIGKSVFEISARVAYVHAGLGMGLIFTDLTMEKVSHLDSLLSEIRGQGDSLADSSPPARSTKSSSPEQGTPFANLVRLLIRKGILTEQEGAKLLPDSRL